MKKTTILILLVLLAFGSTAWAQTVSNATELNSAITNGANITLANDITLSAHLAIPNNTTVTINLDGHTLSRTLTSATSNGCVIVVAQTGSLTLTGGTVSGGNNSSTTGNTAGGIVNNGTLTLNNVTIDNCKGNDGGAIMNKSTGTLNITDGNITENESTEHGGGGIVNYGTVNLSGSVNITGNTCHTKGAGIWSNGTLNMEGNIQVKNNTGDDVFLKTGKVITTGTLTSGQNSIGINMETPGVFTYGYEAHNTGNTLHFFPSGNGNTMGLINGEGKMFYSYYEAIWNSSTNEVVYTQCSVPDNVSVDNICSSKYASGGGLDGNSYWFVADGTGSTSHGLTCYDNTTVNLILCDNAQITLTEGLFVKSGSTLNIYCQSYGDNMGKLITQNPHDYFSGIGARGGDDGAGNAGTINIHGGDITARGGKWGAGIGGGYEYEQTFNCGTITIYGGKISATGGGDSYDNGGAGIGCGYRGQGGSITIYGGEITATGGSNGAGIGGGRASAQTTITINGGTITATGGAPTNAAGAAGIGGGTNGTSGEITINGGTIIANGSKGGAGIGTGSWSNTEATITITGGNIRAYGGHFSVNEGSAFAAGAGIGSGAAYVAYYNLGGDINISGGTIYAEGGRGGSHNSSYHGGGAGIGSGGLADSGGQITISGGTIEAKGGGCSGSSLYDGAGIGGGHESSGGLITISGGHVTATAGGTGAKDIGPGYGETLSTTPTIKDDAQVFITHNNVTATVKKDIAAYSGNGGYYLLTNPVADEQNPETIGMLDNDYDLYGFDQSEELEWRNHEQTSFSLENGIGYLYANGTDTELSFNGVLNPSNADISVPVTYDANADFKGLNLVGNPFVCNAYLLDENNETIPFFKMHNDGNALVAAQAGTAIKPCEGVFVVCPNDGQSHSVIFTTTAPANLGEAEEVPSMLLPVHALPVHQDASPDNVVQTMELIQGWNWVSTYIEVDNPLEMLQMVETSLGENGMEIRDSQVTTEYDSEWGWLGDLDDVGMTNEQMYLIRVSAPCTVTVEGTPANPADHPITINQGWNWIGFPSGVAMSLEAAFADFAQEGDKIRNSESQNEYDPEWGWNGDFETLEPGQGYMYYSASSTARTLVFPASSK
jgi:hypothetical protein